MFSTRGCCERPLLSPANAIRFFLLLLSLSQFIASAPAVSFNRLEYRTGAGSNQVIRADFNGDGTADLASVNSNASSVTVLLGSGTGTFGRRMDFMVGSRPQGLVAVDLNKDGKLDIVTVNAGADSAHTMSVLIGNGDGTFQRARNFFGGEAPGFIVTGDFNCDGRPDIATGWVSSGVNNISIFMGDGAGGFSSEIRTTGVTGTLPGENARIMNGLAAGDFNRDGKLDLAFIECCGGFDVEMGDVFLLRGAGNGQFTPSEIDEFSVPRRLAVADVDQDGYPDLVMPYSGCHTPCEGFVVLRNNRNGTFTASGLDVGDTGRFGFAYATAMDADGDGIKDIVVAGTDFGASFTGPPKDVILIYPRRANGTFGAPAEFTIGTSGKAMHWLAVGDFNRDGKLDLATANFNSSTASVLLNTTPGPTCAPSTANRTVHACSPKSGATVSNPVHFIATTRDRQPITGMKIYVDNSAAFVTADDYINVLLHVAAGAHQITVKAWDAAGPFSTRFPITVR